MRFRATLLLISAIGMAACSDDAAAPDSGGLTRSEALMLASAVTGSVEHTSAAPSARPVGDATASEPITFTQQLESTHPCPQGGSLALTWTATGLIDVEGQSFKLDVAGTHKPAACAYAHEGMTLTLSGDPLLNFEVHVAFAGEHPTAPATVKFNGAFKWSSSDGRSGRCAIDYREVTDFVAKKITREGSVCGHSVKETVSWS